MRGAPPLAVSLYGHTPELRLLAHLAPLSSGPGHPIRIPRPYERNRCAEHEEVTGAFRGVPAAPGVDMVSSSEVPRNAKAAPEEDEKSAAQGQYRGRSPVGSGQSAARGSIKAWVLHLEHSAGVLSFARIATTLLHERLPWVTTVLYPTASEREEGMLALCSSGYSQRWRW